MVEDNAQEESVIAHVIEKKAVMTEVDKLLALFSENPEEQDTDLTPEE